MNTLALEDEMQEKEILREISNRLRSASSIWSDFFLSQSIVFQVPPKQGEPIYYSFASNNTGFLPPYRIEQIILTEINLRVLDKLESIKYSLYYTNAKSALADIWEASRNNGYFLHDLKYISELYRKNNLATIKTYETGKRYSHDKKFTIKASANGYTKKIINTFYSENSEFMSKCDCFKKDNQILIPLFNTPVLCQKFIITKDQKELKQVMDINTLNKAEINDSVLYKGTIYWQYYKNTRLLDLNKERRVAYYRQLFSREIFLEKQLIKVCPEMKNINNIQDSIHKIFFDKEILNKYIKCALPDYFIIVYHYLINAIATNISKSKIEFIDNAKNLKSNIMQIMDIESIINSMVDEKFNRLVKDHNNNIDMVESDLVTQLTGYVDFENHYNVTSYL